MWRRYSEQARRAVFYAQEEAQRHENGFLDTEHLLLGILRQPDCFGSKVLVQIGIDLEVVRAEIEKQLSSSASAAPRNLILSPMCKVVIDLAFKEPGEMRKDYIGTEHLLLGLISSKGIAGEVLAALGVEAEAVRLACSELGDEVPRESNEASGGDAESGAVNLSSEARLVTSAAGVSRGVPAATRTLLVPFSANYLSFTLTKPVVDVLAMAHEEAAALGYDNVSPQHLLIALIKLDGRASKLVASFRPAQTSEESNPTPDETDS